MDRLDGINNNANTKYNAGESNKTNNNLDMDGLGEANRKIDIEYNIGRLDRVYNNVNIEYNACNSNKAINKSDIRLYGGEQIKTDNNSNIKLSINRLDGITRI